jgi:hypothetical protein
MAQLLRLVHRRCPPPSNGTPPNSLKISQNWNPIPLGNKLQRLALIAPMYLQVIEEVVDHILRRVDKTFSIAWVTCLILNSA